MKLVGFKNLPLYEDYEQPAVLMVFDNKAEANSLLNKLKSGENPNEADYYSRFDLQLPREKALELKTALERALK